jgi:hypothetical protein
LGDDSGALVPAIVIERPPTNRRGELALKALLALGALLLARTALAEPIVLECDLPGAGTPGVPIVYQPWHGQFLIDNTWSTDDYKFSKYIKGTGLITISRITGRITQQEETISRIGSCQLASSKNRRF